MIDRYFNEFDLRKLTVFSELWILPVNVDKSIFLYNYVIMLGTFSSILFAIQAQDYSIAKTNIRKFSAMFCVSTH